jgi:hypothetical protein
VGTTRRAPAETDRGAGTVRPGRGAFRVHDPTGQPGQGGARLHSRLCRVHCGLCTRRRLLNFQAPRRSSPARDRRPAQWTVQAPPAPWPFRDPQLSMTTGLVIHGMTGTGRAQEAVLGFPDPSGGEVAPTSREGPMRSWGTHLFRRDGVGSLPDPDDGNARASTETGLADLASRAGSRCPGDRGRRGRPSMAMAMAVATGDRRAALRVMPAGGTLTAGPDGTTRAGTRMTRARGRGGRTWAGSTT